MPANLPPQYYEAEKHYRLAKEPEEKVEALETMLAIMPKHKGTDKLRADLRTRIAKLLAQAQKKVATSHKGGGYYVRKEEAGQAALVGLPNAGKSSLLSAVTNAAPDIADYPFTTKQPTPGMMNYKDIQIQLIDLPPITDSSTYYWLRGILKRADALLLVIDLSEDPLTQVKTVIAELEHLKIKLAGQEPRPEGGKAIIVGSKNDLNNSADNYRILTRQYNREFPLISTSAKERIGLEELKNSIYTTLDIIRVYTKAPREKAALNKPVILRRGSTVKDAAESVHKDFLSELKYTLLWGSGKFNSQRVKKDYILEDGDIIELHV